MIFWALTAEGKDAAGVDHSATTALRPWDRRLFFDSFIEHIQAAMEQMDAVISQVRWHIDFCSSERPMPVRASRHLALFYENIRKADEARAMRALGLTP